MVPNHASRSLRSDSALNAACRTVRGTQDPGQSTRGSAYCWQFDSQLIWRLPACLPCVQMARLICSLSSLGPVIIWFWYSLTLPTNIGLRAELAPVSINFLVAFSFEMFAFLLLLWICFSFYPRTRSIGKPIIDPNLARISQAKI